MLRVHLTPLLQPLDDLSYTLSDQEFHDFQVNDPWCKNFLVVVEQIYSHLKKVIAAPSLAEILNNLIDRVCNRLDETVKKKGFNILGAVMLHQDIMTLSSFFQSRFCFANYPRKKYVLSFGNFCLLKIRTNLCLLRQVCLTRPSGISSADSTTWLPSSTWKR